MIGASTRGVLRDRVAGGKSSGDRRRPEDHPLPLRVVVEELRRPGVERGRLVLHHRDALLLGPVDQIARVGDANAVVSPGDGPYHMEHPVGALEDARIAHQRGSRIPLLPADAVAGDRGANHRPAAVERRPGDPVLAVGEVDAVFAVAGEVGEEEGRGRRGSGRGLAACGCRDE